jgi:Zn-finger nucleic acid-binding protein
MFDREDKIIPVESSPQKEETKEGKIAEGFLVMREDDVEMYKNWVKKKIEVWHELNPDLVILSDSSAVPIGFALKEAYIKTYGKENSPKFYRFDPKAVRIPHKWVKEGAPPDLSLEDIENDPINISLYKNDAEKRVYALELQKELKRFVGKGKRVITYDETSRMPGKDPCGDKIIQMIVNGVRIRDERRDDIPLSLLVSKSQKNWDGKGPDCYWGQGNIGLHALVSAVLNKGDVWLDSGEPNKLSKYPNAQWKDIRDCKYYHQINGFDESRYENPISKRKGPKKDPQKKESAMKFIHDLKLLGQQAAEEILKEQKEK